MSARVWLLLILSLGAAFAQPSKRDLNQAIRDDDVEAVRRFACAAPGLLNDPADYRDPFQMKPRESALIVSESPLKLAVQKGNAETVRALVGCGADPNYQDNLSPMSAAVELLERQWQDRPESALEVLVAIGLKQAPAELKSRVLVDAARKTNLRRVILALNAGADPESMDGDGLTVLHLAARNRQQAIIDVMLKAKADPANEDFLGMTYRDVQEAMRSGLMEKIETVRAYLRSAVSHDKMARESREVRTFGNPSGGNQRIADRNAANMEAEVARQLAREQIEAAGERREKVEIYFRRLFSSYQIAF